MKPRSISLCREIDLIRSTVAAMRLLAERLLEVPLGDSGLPPGLAWSLRAGLWLVELRLRDIERVVAGQLDPELLLCAANSVEPKPDPNERDVRLGWSEKERIKKLRTELGRAQRRRRHRRKHRRQGPTP